MGRISDAWHVGMAPRSVAARDASSAKRLSVKRSVRPACSAWSQSVGEVDWSFGLGRQHRFDGTEAALQAVARFIERELPAIDDGHAVGEALDFLNIVRGHKHGPALLLGELQQAADEFITHERIESAEGFIKHDELRVDTRGC
jgi:hypothetical protein